MGFMNYFFTVVILLAFFFFLLRFIDSIRLRMLRKKYNKDNDKTRKGGEDFRTFERGLSKGTGTTEDSKHDLTRSSDVGEHKLLPTTEAIVDAKVGTIVGSYKPEPSKVNRGNKFISRIRRRN